MPDPLDPPPAPGDERPQRAAAPGPILPEHREDLVAALPRLLATDPAHGDIVVVLTCQRQIRQSVHIRPFTDALDPPAAWQQLAATLSVPMPGADACVVVAYTGPDTAVALQDLADNATVALSVLRVHEGRIDTVVAGPPGPGRAPTPTPRPSGDGTREAFADADRELIATPSPASVLIPVQAHLQDLALTALRRRRHPLAGTASDWFQLVAAEHDRRAEGPVPMFTGTAVTLLPALQDEAVLGRCLAWSDDGAWWLWSRLLRRAPHGWAAPVATLIASAAILRENLSLATAALERALADTPDYPMAWTLRTFLRNIPSPALAIGLAQIYRAAGAQPPPDIPH
jgi:hypothetical protein